MNTKAKVGDRGQIVDVQVTTDREGHVHVSPVWKGVDRPNVGGWVVKDQRTADRLTLALMAGAVFDDPRVREDLAGRTYVHGTANVLGRYLNADLRRLGY